jgi:hypothetical protein
MILYLRFIKLKNNYSSVQVPHGIFQSAPLINLVHTNNNEGARDSDCESIVMLT